MSVVQNVLRTLPENADDRKSIPIVTGVLDYFPLALAEVARISKAGNDQHNPGQPLHWARGKSADHADCVGRHLIGRGTRDTDGQRHTAKAAWRVLALLQEEMEAAAGWTPTAEPAALKVFDPDRVVDWPDGPGTWQYRWPGKGWKTDESYQVTSAKDDAGDFVVWSKDGTPRYRRRRDRPETSETFGPNCDGWRKVAA